MSAPPASHRVSCPVRAARRAGAVAAVLGLTLALVTGWVVLHVAPAAAVEARAVGPELVHAVQVGTDGVHFGSTLDRPLFAGLPVLVPGDAVTVPLWVRNDGAQAGQVRLSGTDAWSTSAVFAEQLSLTAAEAGSTAPAVVPLARAAECALLVAGPVLEPGESRELVVTLAFSPETTGREAHDARAGVDVVVALRDPAEPASPTADCAGTVVPAFPSDPRAASGSGRAGDAIAATGLPTVLLTMTAAVAVVVAVPLLVIARRRRGSR